MVVGILNFEQIGVGNTIKVGKVPAKNWVLRVDFTKENQIPKEETNFRDWYDDG
jgi:hypothetical protein